LYAPVIDLSGLKSATLTFWCVYNFNRLDPIFGLYYEEDGGVFVSTNSSTLPSLNLPLGLDYAGTEANTWQQKTVDLTQFVGQTIQVVFYYQAFAFGDPIYGWTLDDVSITGVVAGGNVSITKNLGQGTWSLSSLSSLGLVPVQSDTAPSVTLSNLAAGQYVVQFGDVPYYQTPDGQTNTLAVDGTVNFSGNYTFLDANHNGISDAWEMAGFGSVTTNRTQLTDTDGDGMSDYAEFIAGTNPTNAASRLVFLSVTVATNHSVQLEWAAVPGRVYQILSSTNLNTWTPLTDRQQASGSPMSCTGTNLGSNPHFFRAQVWP
jgi:hypothetical protein